MHARNLLKNKVSGHELPKKNSATNAETASVRKRKAGVLSADKHPKLIRQGSPRQSLEREEVRLDYSFNRAVSPLSVNLNRFSFSADMYEASELAEKALKGELTKLPKKSPLMASKNPKKPAESTKTNKKPIFLKNSNFIQNGKQLRDLFYKINPDIKILKTTIYSSGNIKIIPKTISDYRLAINYAFSSAFYRLTKKHITVEESTNTFF